MADQVFLPPPALAGSEPQKLQQVYTYLFQMSEQLNLALGSLEQGSAVPAAGTAAAPAGGGAAAGWKEQYGGLKALVVKTADTVRAELDKLTATLSGTYVAQSEFGTYVQNLSAYLEANPEAVTQYYKFVSDLQADVEAVDAAFTSYQVETGGYIKTGIGYYDGAVPIYGVAVGQNLQSTEVDGETVIDQAAFRATFTANRLSFWQDDQEVAYVSNNKLYIREVAIDSRLSVGRWMLQAGSGLVVKWNG